MKRQISRDDTDTETLNFKNTYDWYLLMALTIGEGRQHARIDSVTW